MGIGHFINCVQDIDYNDKIDESQYMKENDDEKDEFDQLEFITTAPSIHGVNVNTFSLEEYVNKVNAAILISTSNNDKERVKAVVDVLIRCNDKQRVQINAKCDGLMDKFKLYSKNKNVLKLLDLMLKPLSECDAEWLYDGINKKDENIVIEILFTRTNKQLKELIASYKEIYGDDLENDIKTAFNKKDETFVI